MTAPPLILTAWLADKDQARFDSLRQAHFPPERNVIAAHLTVFHHLPGDDLATIRHCVQVACAHQPPERAAVTGLRSLGRGVAFEVQAPGLAAVRSKLVQAWHGSLTAQDRQGWRPHITVQNKVTPADASALLAAMRQEFVPFTMGVKGMQLWRYLAGPWEAVETFAFTGPPDAE